MRGIISRLIANKATEQDIRDYLSEVGYLGATAEFLRLELAAVERPGWVQVFEFQIQAEQQNGKWEERFGLCRTDERSATFDVQLFSSKRDQQAALERETQGMISRSRRANHWVKTLLMIIFVGAIGKRVAERILRERVFRIVIKDQSQLGYGLIDTIVLLI